MGDIEVREEKHSAIFQCLQGVPTGGLKKIKVYV